jgi:tetratricopeptide (TPR) repeat protein
MFGVEADAQTLEQIKRVGALNRQGRFAEALAALQQLPPQLREQRVLLRLQIVLASKSNDEAAYRKALAGFAASYGGDPADAFTLIDHYYYQQDYEKLLQAIAIVEKRVGTDGVVLLLRSNVELARRDFPRATTLAKSAIELEPGLWAAHLALLKAHAGLGNFDAGVRGIRAWEQSVGTPVPSEVLASQPDLAEFMKSREYAVWSAKRGTEGK